jgi:hypothetical protein
MSSLVRFATRPHAGRLVATLFTAKMTCMLTTLHRKDQFYDTSSRLLDRYTDM